MIGNIISHYRLIFAQSGVRPVLAATSTVLLTVTVISVLFRFGILGGCFSFHGAFDWRLHHYAGLFARYVWSFIVALLAILAALAIHGFRVALAGHPLFGHAVLEDLEARGGLSFALAGVSPSRSMLGQERQLSQVEVIWRSLRRPGLKQRRDIESPRCTCIAVV